MSPARDGGDLERAGRWAKARQFADTADLLHDDATGAAESPDAFVTLAVHAGIACADVICIARLGQYSATGSHAEAAALLKKADPEAAKHLERLLAIKTKAGYTHRTVSNDDVATANRAYRALLARADSVR